MVGANLCVVWVSGALVSHSVENFVSRATVDLAHEPGRALAGFIRKEALDVSVILEITCYGHRFKGDALIREDALIVGSFYGPSPFDHSMRDSTHILVRKMFE